LLVPSSGIYCSFREDKQCVQHIWELNKKCFYDPQIVYFIGNINCSIFMKFSVSDRYQISSQST
jgi:hypothetical protein